MSYKEQLERAKRWFERFKASSSHPNSDYDPFPLGKQDDYLDFLYAFFQNCWHVGDWILADENVPTKLKEAVKSLKKLRDLPSLKLCEDVANGSKHPGKARNEQRRVRTVGIIEVDIKEEEKTETNYKYVVDDDGASHPALDLARKALEEWETVIKENGG